MVAYQCHDVGVFVIQISQAEEIKKRLQEAIALLQETVKGRCLGCLCYHTNVLNFSPCIILPFYRLLSVGDPGVAEWSCPATEPEAGTTAFTAGARDEHLPHPRWLLCGGLLPGQGQSDIGQTEPGKHHTGQLHCIN